MRLLSEIRNYMGNYHVKSGVYHYNRNEFNQAISFLRKALDEATDLSEGDRNNATSYLTLSLKGLGEKLDANGEVEDGVGQLRQALELSPNFPDVHYLLGGMLQRLGRLDEAVQAFRNALRTHENYVDAQIALAYCLAAAGKNDEAGDAFERALELKLGRIQRPFRDGLAKLADGRTDEAMKRFHEVFRAVPRMAAEYLDAANEHRRAGEYEEALEALDHALDLNPRYPDLHNFRGIVLCDLERFDEAVGSFRRSSELSPTHGVPRLNLAFAYLRAGQVPDAEGVLESILDNKPTDPVASAKIEELRNARLVDQRSGSARPSGG